MGECLDNSQVEVWRTRWNPPTAKYLNSSSADRKSQGKIAGFLKKCFSDCNLKLHQPEKRNNGCKYF